MLANGDETEFLLHGRGLGDPLSPMLFILATEAFHKFVQGANSTLSKLLSNKIVDFILALQFADDTDLFPFAKIGHK